MGKIKNLVRYAGIVAVLLALSIGFAAVFFSALFLNKLQGVVFRPAGLSTAVEMRVEKAHLKYLADKLRLDPETLEPLP